MKIHNAYHRLKRIYHELRQELTAPRRHFRDWLGTFSVLRGRPAPWSLDADVDSRMYHDNEEPLTHPGVVVMLDGAIHHGGLTDRLRGILTAYSECRRLGLPFYIHWTTPFRLTDYLKPAAVDWRIPDEAISRSRSNSRAVVIDDMTDRESRRRLRAALRHRPAQLHLYTNADSARGNYRELYHELFTPVESIRRAVAAHQECLGPEYVSITCRFLTLLGDFDDWLQKVLPEEEQKRLIESVCKEIKGIMEKYPSETRFHVTSDSGKFLSAAKKLDPRIYVVEGDIRNVDLNRDEQGDPWRKTFIDQNLLMGARTVYRLRTGEMYPTGFASFAAEVGAAEFIDHVF